MIIDKEVSLKIGGKNIKYFKTLYSEIKMLQEITIPVEQLTDGSNVKINCLCDICGKKRNITYQKYKDSEKLYGEYTCQKCSNIKRKKTTLKIYGVENYLESKEFSQKSKITINEKYGCDNVFQSEKIKEKIKNHWKENFGVDHLSKTIEYKEKIKKTNRDRYGNDCYYRTDDFKIKSDKTKIIRYDNVNFNNVDKAKETRIKNGNMVAENDLPDWKLYKRIVWRLTNRNKKKLYKNWLGYDYYDNEYIMENLLLIKYDKNYPTIDHKISIKYGFDNCILPSIIANEDNLCITKRIINCRKSSNNSL